MPDITINLDLSEANKLLAAYKSALLSFCQDFAQSKPEFVPQAEAALDDILTTFGLSPSTFDDAKRMLRGEMPEQATTDN